MCGIVGMIAFNKNQFFSQNINAFKNLLLLDSFRGEDGTGIFAVDKDFNVDLWKSGDPSGKFIYTKEYDEFEKGLNNKYNVVVGHNRKATVGKINDDTAHPFISGNIVMVHNGKLEQHRTYFDTEVDSEALCKYLEKHKDDEDLPKALSELDGAFSVVWYNAEKKMIYFWRNDKRPMYHLVVGSVVYFSSEKSIGHFAIAKAGSNVLEKDITDVAPDMLHSLDLSENVIKWKSVPVPKKVKVLPKSSYPLAQGGYYGGHYACLYGNGYNEDGVYEDETAAFEFGKPAATEKKEEPTKATVLPLKKETKKGEFNTFQHLTDKIGKKELFRYVDDTIDPDVRGSNLVEGIYRDNVSVICENACEEFIKDLKLCVHQTIFFWGTVRSVTSSSNGDTYEILVDSDIKIYEGFQAANGTLVSYENIEDAGGQDAIYCCETHCYNYIDPEDYEDTAFKFKYDNDKKLTGYRFICKDCLAAKKAKKHAH